MQRTRKGVTREERAMLNYRQVYATIAQLGDVNFQKKMWMRDGWRNFDRWYEMLFDDYRVEDLIREGWYTVGLSLDQRLQLERYVAALDAFAARLRPSPETGDVLRMARWQDLCAQSKALVAALPNPDADPFEAAVRVQTVKTALGKSVRSP